VTANPFASFWRWRGNVGRSLARNYIRGHGLSPLTLRIMAVNALALAILVASILYLASYQDRLIEVEIESLKSEARIFANAIAESATLPRNDESDQLVRPLARQMVRRLDEVTDARTRLYDPESRLMADSLMIGHAANLNVQRIELDPLDKRNFLLRQLDAMMEYIGRDKRKMPIYVEDDPRLPVVRQEIQDALKGREGVQVWKLTDGPLLFSIAVPVQSYKNVLGVLNLTRDSKRMNEAIENVRMDILKLFFGSLLVTIILSLYLARSIARPIRLLAVAADQVRAGQSRIGKTSRNEIPDFTGRNDEIGDLSGAFRAMTESLWKRMDAIEAFAADVAHEIKNPLASMRSAVETLGKVKDDVPRNKLLGILHHDVQRLDRLISDISGASRLDAELSRMESQKIDVVQLMKTIVNITCNQEDNGCNVYLTTTEDSIMVQGFEGRLVQVFQNLIDNALSFSPPQGTVRVMVMRVDKKAVITVGDDGPGIPEAKLEAVFDRFYSERPAGEDYGKHSGLGLSIVKQIVDAHKGRVYAANRYNADGAVVGAVFTVELAIA